VSGPASGAGAFRATTRPLPGTPDVLAASGDSGLFWQRERSGLAGRGEALRIHLPHGLDEPGAADRVAHALGAIAADDEVGRPGTGPVAMGALPFDRGAPASVVVPEVLVGTDGESSWVTTVRRADAGQHAGEVERRAEEVVAAALGHRTRPAPAPPDEFRLVPSLSHARWMEVVAEAVEHIRAGDLGKVVLARRVDIEANRPFATSDVLERLGALYPSCMVFRMEGFVGASPELLISRRDLTVASHPLAGTVARSGDAAADRGLVDALLASPKERAEHAFVVDELGRALAPWCEALDVPDRPSILELRNVSHLATAVTGRLRPAPPTALRLVDAVHPTPAVAGTPTDKATAYLQTAEGFDRGRYAGPVGWVSATGDGDWAIGIRSAVVDGARASICAGVGVVADSDPRAELAETQLKLQALLAALVRP